MYLLPQSQLNTIQIQIKNISFSSKLQYIPTGALWRHWVRGAKTFEQRRWRGKRLKRSKCNKCQILKIMIHFCSSTRQKCFRRYVVINVRWKNKMLDFQCSVICFVLPQFSPRSFLQILSTPLDKRLKCGNTIILPLILKPHYAIILTGSLSTQNDGNDDNNY